MRPVLRRITVIALLGLITAAMPTTARAATAAQVEAALAAKVNQGRAGQGRAALLNHQGLETIAGDWSSQMAATNNFTHGNFSGRFQSATPDPAESNGAPDDGFTGWCENIAWNSLAQSSSADQVAQMFYNQWFNSTSGHKECMLSLSPRNFGQNVMGVGIVYDSADGRWWATLDIAKDTTPPTTWTRVQQTSSAVTYSGSWSSDIASSNSSGGSYRRSRSTGAYARFRCTSCTGVRWIGLRTTNAGIAEVRLDGALVRTIDTYRSSVAYQRAIYTRTGLPSGTHTLEIRVKGTKNPDATTNYIYIDAFDRTSS